MHNLKEEHFLLILRDYGKKRRKKPSRKREMVDWKFQRSKNKERKINHTVCNKQGTKNILQEGIGITSLLLVECCYQRHIYRDHSHES